jgi:hypothetical protein
MADGWDFPCSPLMTLEAQRAGDLGMGVVFRSVSMNVTQPIPKALMWIDY